MRLFAFCLSSCHELRSASHCAERSRRSDPARGRHARAGLGGPTVRPSRRAWPIREGSRTASALAAQLESLGPHKHMPKIQALIILFVNLNEFWSTAPPFRTSEGDRVSVLIELTDPDKRSDGNNYFKQILGLLDPICFLGLLVFRPT
jgi:hypothetical protein